MNQFDKVIGYEPIKKNLLQLCDMIQNPEPYRKLGARLPRGLMLKGEPGVGKTLMAEAFLAECGRPAYVVRRNRPDGDFINEMRRIFEEAAKTAPSVVLLDDMDKFTVREKDREEMVALQACIDGARSADVFIIATVNDLRQIPQSLLRAGRFDRRITVSTPNAEDAEAVIRYYLSGKPYLGELNMEDVTGMMQNHSCAELETILNEAAVLAGSERGERLEMSHIVRAVRRTLYHLPEDGICRSEAQTERIAWHEAGHLTMLEVLSPGSVGIGVISRIHCKSPGCVTRRSDRADAATGILVSLAGKAATDLHCPTLDLGAGADLGTALRGLVQLSETGVFGVDLLGTAWHTSEQLYARRETVLHAQCEQYEARARALLLRNEAFLRAVAEELLAKETLLVSDIRRLRESVPIIRPAKQAALAADAEDADDDGADWEDEACDDEDDDFGDDA